MRGDFPDQMATILKKKVDFYRVACRRYILESILQDDLLPGAGELMKRSKILKSECFDICPADYSGLSVCEGEFLMKFPKHTNSILHFKLHHEEIQAYCYLGEQVFNLLFNL